MLLKTLIWFLSCVNYAVLMKPFCSVCMPSYFNSHCAPLSRLILSSSTTAHSLFFANWVLPGPTWWILDKRQSTCALTAAWDNLRLSCPTMTPSSCLLRGFPAFSPWKFSRDSARVWIKLWTSTLASPHAPKHNPINWPNSSSRRSTGPFSPLLIWSKSWSTFLAFREYSVWRPVALLSVPRTLPDVLGLYHVSQQLMSFNSASRYVVP